MAHSKIIIVNGLSIDLSRIKAIKVNTNSTLGPTNVLMIDLNLRFEYVFNPNENNHTKESIKDTVSINYVNYDGAVEAMNNLSEEWQAYLNSL
ncbi:hypothetical protein A5893_09625 [Pedobacter psychrophilus]|uniref:Uncharacterized protein n=1 Tax=Pedobacter psychrophilus TaxID=1826909 RepID=A0A179DG13_9SPHI|nr:hypothetical protein [Pedobacter psychrophilus]OAQ39824.1 hypothetical protein A5893_09625 [Pedobacter psychrophilus]